MPQKTQFYWKYSNGTLERKSGIDGPKTEVIFGTQPIRITLGTWTTCSAYLASELGEMLPEIPHYRLRIEKTGSSWDIEYRASCYDAPMGELVFACLEPSEADARAKMLIHLLENHLISVEELGK